MEYTVSEIARTAGLTVDTVRFYQTRGLLALPERRGRSAVYDDSHLERLRLVRQMAERGLSLRAISLLLERGEPDSDHALLLALEEENPEPALGTDDLAQRLGVPPALVRSIESTGLAGDADDADDGEHRYSRSDLDAASAALKLLEHGFPLTRLLALAVRHDRHTRRTVDAAIDLFDDHVRKHAGGEINDADSVARAFKEILPVVTGLVAHHFQRLLINRALKRLRKKGDGDVLKVAVEVARKNKVKLRWA
ncbi:MAG: DNA-binding transcriptional MerR regulator [Hyphomicrobiaceae bacterium]